MNKKKRSMRGGEKIYFNELKEEEKICYEGLDGGRYDECQETLF